MTEPKKESIWNLTFVCCTISNIFFCFSHFITTPLVTSYATLLGAGATLVGLLAGLYACVAFAMRPVSGPAITMLNKKTLLILVYIMGAIVNLLYAASGSVPLFIVARILHGIQYSFIGSLCLTVASASLPKSKIASGIGIYTVSGIFGQAIGPSIGIALQAAGASMWGEAGGYKLAFFVGAMCYVAGLIPCFFVEKGHTLDKEERKALGPWYANIIAVPAIPYALMMFFFCMGFILFSTYLVPYAEQYGISGISTFFIVNAIATFAVRPISGPIQDKFGFKPLMPPCLILYAASFFLTGIAANLPMVLVAGALSGLGWGAIQPAVQAMAMASVPTEKGGSASNTNFFGVDLGFFFGPTIGGIIYAATQSYHTMFMFGVVAVALGTIVFIAICVRDKKKNSN